MSRSSGPGVQTVIAAQEGDEEALENLLSEYLPLIYNIVGRGLNGHADVDDVVQETMLRVVRSVRDLRDPEAFRSWLVAVAIRQMHDHRQQRQAAPAGRPVRPDDLGGRQRHRRDAQPGQSGGPDPAGLQRARHGQPVEYDGLPGAQPVAATDGDRDEPGQPGRRGQRRQAGGRQVWPPGRPRAPRPARTTAPPRGGWLAHFMRGPAARGYRVNFITVH